MINLISSHKERFVSGMNQICLKAALRKCNLQQFINQSNIGGRLCTFQTLESVVAKSIPCGAE
jgi:hypothetical protein